MGLLATLGMTPSKNKSKGKDKNKGNGKVNYPTSAKNRQIWGTLG